jgi:hypothetical protein
LTMVLSVLLLFTIVLSVLLPITASEYHFGMFNFVLDLLCNSNNNYIKIYTHK